MRGREDIVRGSRGAQGMLLLAGSTTVYNVLPSAGEKKKQHLQARLLRACAPLRSRAGPSMRFRAGPSLCRTTGLDSLSSFQGSLQCQGCPRVSPTGRARNANGDTVWRRVPS